MAHYQHAFTRSDRPLVLLFAVTSHSVLAEMAHVNDGATRPGETSYRIVMEALTQPFEGRTGARNIQDCVAFSGQVAKDSQGFAGTRKETLGHAWTRMDTHGHAKPGQKRRLLRRHANGCVPPMADKMADNRKRRLAR
jgi:hypothetical protein